MENSRLTTHFVPRALFVYCAVAFAVVLLTYRLAGAACVDSDGDGFGDPGVIGNTCPTDNCPNVYNPAQTDTDGDGIGDACDPCTRQPISISPVLHIRTGLLKFTFHTTIDSNFDSLDPETTGLRALITDTAGNTVLDVTLPGGAYAGPGSAGWQQRKNAWVFRDKTASPQIQKLVIHRDRRCCTFRVRLETKGGSYPFSFGSDLAKADLVFGDQTAADAGRCVEAYWLPSNCSSSGVGTRCRYPRP